MRTANIKQYVTLENSSATASASATLTHPFEVMRLWRLLGNGGDAHLRAIRSGMLLSDDYEFSICWLWSGPSDLKSIAGSRPDP
jgi:hypothetical protein